MLHLPLRTINFILSEFEKKLKIYDVETYIIDDFRKVLLLEDSLALYVGIEKSTSPICLNAEETYAWTHTNKFIDLPSSDGTYYELKIEELTYNTLGFKYNHSKFIRKMEELTQIPYLELDITYSKFKGYTRLYWCLETKTLAEEMNLLLPKLRLRERYESWEGVHYNLIVIELDSIDNKTEYAVAYTTQNPNSYIISKCKEWIKKGFTCGDMRVHYSHFKNAFDSWKGIRRQVRLENHMRYFYLEKNFREKDDVWRYCDIILNNAYNGKYISEEKSTYTRPINKWISEEQVYIITKKLYKDFNVIYQHRPFFLRSSMGGQMSYDVYISGLNIAIEYQGKQHFEPIEYFGGEIAYQNTIKRDKEKLFLSNKNNIKLIYINYWETITPKLIRDKIESALNIL
ncbi:hypothetical protein [Clostridium perfringens]